MPDKIATRITKKFQDLRSRSKKGFIAYITAGDPTLRDTADTILRLEEAGVDIIELGIPFSDPMADGVVNQQAAERALRAGATFGGILEMVHKIREKTDIPILFFSYLNPLFAHGFERAVRQSAQAGIDGFLLLDLSFEESAAYRNILHQHKVNWIGMISPTTTEARLHQITSQSSGFVYCVSRMGVTGSEQAHEETIKGIMQHVHAASSIPAAVGFGISTAEQVVLAGKHADAVVVGSAIVKRFHEEEHTAKGRINAAAWVGTLVKALKEIKE